jgi:hypothetical protein
MLSVASIATCRHYCRKITAKETDKLSYFDNNLDIVVCWFVGGELFRTEGYICDLA